MESDPFQYLMKFAESDILSEQDGALRGRYLVLLWADENFFFFIVLTFNQLRLEIYTCTTQDIDMQPPTSISVCSHIHRATFLVKWACHLLAGEFERENSLEAVVHGWEEHVGVLLLEKNLCPLPPNIFSLCKCAFKCGSR